YEPGDHRGYKHSCCRPDRDAPYRGHHVSDAAIAPAAVHDPGRSQMVFGAARTDAAVAGKRWRQYPDWAGATVRYDNDALTAALHLAMMALDIGQGDEVVVPAFTWVTTAHAAEYVGARPVFVDVSSDTYNIDPARIEAAITPRTRAVVAVHLFGLAAPMAEI